MYKLKVENGIVVGIQASSTPKCGDPHDDIVTIVDILREKYRAAFVWPNYPSSSNEGYQLARHIGYGDDYTVLEVEHRSRPRTFTVDHWLTVSLYLDTVRKNRDRVWSWKKVRKPAIDPHKFDGIDAL